MPTEILMPALSPTMEEGTLAKWLVKEGDTVSSGDLLAEIETDKATMEFEAVDEGIIGKLLVAEGTEAVKVNTAIAVLLEDGESADDISSSPAAAPKAEPAAAETPTAAPAAATPAPAAPARASGDLCLAPRPSDCCAKGCGSCCCQRLRPPRPDRQNRCGSRTARCSRGTHRLCCARRSHCCCPHRPLGQCRGGHVRRTRIYRNAPRRHA